jgi:signal transduction histidine kinase
LKDLSEKIVHSLSQAMGIQTVVLYLFDRKKNLYVPASSYGESLSIFPPLKLDTTERLKKALSQGYSSLVREEIEQDGPDSLNIPVLHSLQAMGAEVCVPLINQNRVIGFCALGKRMGNGIYSAQDLNLLSTLAHEAAIALDNALLYEELKRSQALIRRTDRLRSLETIAGGMAHEIRNPLTSIKAFIDLAPGRCHDEEFLTRFGRVVKDDVARIERLTKEILDYARPTEPYLQKEDVNNIVESCLSVLRMRPLLEIITCETSLEQGSLPIFVDRHQIKQVLLNLLFNAVESMEPSGGTLTVQTRKVNQKPEELWVQVEVRDTGPGIAPKDLEHIFDPFFTTKHFSQEYEGTGLGLAMAHQIIQENHGNIEVNSEVGKGTTFFVNLPAYEKEPNFVRGTQESGGMTS